MATKDWKKTSFKGTRPHILYQNKKIKNEWIVQHKSHGIWVLEYIKDKKGDLTEKTFKTKSAATRYAKSYINKH